MKSDSEQSREHVHNHLPFLIIPLADVARSYVPGMIINECFIVDLSAAGSLELPIANTPGKLDATDLRQNGYSWQRDIDKDFTPDPNNREDVILNVSLRQGTLEAVRFGQASGTEDAVLTAVTIHHDHGERYTLRAGGEILFRDGAELVVANVAPEWLHGDRNYVDDDKHFFIYHRMSSTPITKCAKARGKSPKNSNAKKNPYITERGRGLRVSCSNTTYP